MGTLVLLDLLGGVALLLWGLHMVQSGILRAFGPDLRRALGKALGNRFSALAAGLGLTALLQSSTATGLMTASFSAEGAIGLVPALAIMLGANIGTTLIVKLLSFNIAAVAPVLFVIGLVSFRSGGRSRLKDIGRVSIGLGLMLLALHILLNTLAPAENAPAMRALFGALTGDPVLCVLIAAALTWAAHSSVATVLLFMSLAFSHFITAEAALALVLGANLGSAINPVLEGVRRGDPAVHPARVRHPGAGPASYRLPVGNLVNRAAGIVLVLPFLPMLAQGFVAFEPNAAQMTALFHIAFNVATAIVFIGLLGPQASLLTRLFPARQAAADEDAPRYLDEAALDTPALALSDAAREALRMVDTVDDMLRKVMQAMTTNDATIAAQVSRMDDTVDRLDEAVKLYITKLTRGNLDDREATRAMEIVSFTINLEHIGDIVDKNLTELATKKIKRGLQFSPEGAAELVTFHGRVLDSFKTAFTVFMSGDVEAARRLIAGKADLKRAELDAADRHMARLRDGRPETIETTSLHLDVLRDLRRIHSHICAVAYAALAAAGQTAPQKTGDIVPATLSAQSRPVQL